MALVSYPSGSEEKNLPVYVTGVGVSYAQPAVSWHIGTSSQIIMTVAGCGVITVGEQKYEIPAGCGFYLSGGVGFSISPREKKHTTAASVWLTDWVTFDFASPELKETLFTSKDCAFFSFRDPAIMAAGMRKIHDVIESDAKYGCYTASAEIYSLLIGMNRELLEIPRTSDKMNPALEDVMKYIDDNFTEEISLADLCTAAGGISEQYLCRLFKQCTGERPIEFILHKRISMARSYLEKTDMPISEVARLTGFNNTSYFYRNFKKFMGVSPLACRQNTVMK